MKYTPEETKEQNAWNFIFVLIFIAFTCYLLFLLLNARGEFPTSISLFDFALMTLAVFRIIRLFVYDRITKWFRDMFVGFESGPGKTINDLLGCPWCIGVWASVVVVFFYYLSSISWIVILMLAVASVASFLQILANLIGWKAENLKLDANTKY